MLEMTVKDAVPDAQVSKKGKESLRKWEKLFGKGSVAAAMLAVDDMRAHPASVGEMLDHLNHLDDKLPIEFDVGGAPREIDSYQGFYEDVALENGFKKDTTPTVGSLKKLLKDSIGKLFEGYKGGNYKPVSESTSVWASDWGEASGRGVVGFSPEKGKVVIVTKEM